jgi:hypothetical protein
MTARFPDWERRLHDFIADNLDRPFQWGEWDCALFATACAAAITGHDAAAAYRGTYDSRTGSARALRELGQGTLLRTMNASFTPKSVGQAGRGDLVWHNGSIGVCMGRVALFVGEERLADSGMAVMREGLIQIERRHWTRAWAVGEAANG